MKIIEEGISIIIPTYNRALLLDFTLKSIKNQHFNTSLIEIIVVDDGSMDNTIEVIRKYQNYLNIKYIYVKDEGYCVGNARNLGIKNASSDICLLLDAGVGIKEDCVFQHLQSHKFNSGCISVIGYVYGFSNEQENQDDLKMLISNEKEISEIIDVLDRENRFKDIRETEYANFKYKIDCLPAPWVYYWTCQVSINKNSLPVGEPFFDPIYNGNYGFEDVDLGYKLHTSGTKIILNKDAKAIHYPHDKQENYMQNNLANQHLFEKKNSSEIVNLFIKNGGTTFGFNNLLLSYKLTNKKKVSSRYSLFKFEQIKYFK